MRTIQIPMRPLGPYKVQRREVLRAFEIQYVGSLLRASKQNLSEAARMGKMDRKHLWRIIQRLGPKARREMGIT